jgi:putative ABC transport system permease protein
MRALDRKLTRDLWHLRGQVLAIALVLACGVAMSVMALGMLRSLEQTRDSYYERYRFADVFAHVKRAPQRLVRRLAEVPDVAAVDARVTTAATLDVPGMDEPATARVLSLPGRGEAVLNDIAMRIGRRPAPGRTGEVLVGEAFAEAHAMVPGDSFRATINGVARPLTVVGIALSPEYVYAIGPGSLVPDDRRFAVLWMEERALAAVTDMTGAFNDVSFALLPGASEAAAIADIDRLLEPYGGTGAYGRDRQTSNWFLDGEMKELASMAQIVPPIFLGVAAFLLNIVVGRLVATQREQIGLLKALGYRDMAVGWHYGKLVGSIVLAGSLLGLGTGIWFGRGLAELYTQFFRFPFLHYEIGAPVIVGSVLVAFAAAALGTLAALRRVVRLPPAVAMQPPAPPRYRRAPGFLAAIGRSLLPSTRMIFRHIFRWPLRAALTTISLAMAVAVLVASMFMLDAVDLMLDVHFHQSNRQDVSVAFNAPLGIGAMHEIARLPGVRRVEPFRAVPVRLSFGHRSRRSAITGIAPGADLSRPIGADAEPLVPPPEGLMLSTWLAGELGVGRGDWLHVEAMEGRRPARALPVTALVEDVIGAEATMDMAALNRFMGEGPSISGAHLLTDSAETGSLYRRIKGLPAVADIVIMTQALAKVRETLAENLLLMTTFNIGFAGLIAFGVVFNAAQIALSERARELASLRVLGFRRREVSFILLGELALLALLALPIGCAIGRVLAWAMSLGLQSDLYRVPLVVEPATYGTAIAVVVASALLCGVLIVRRVAGLDLVAVLKTRE